MKMIMRGGIFLLAVILAGVAFTLPNYAQPGRRLGGGLRERGAATEAPTGGVRYSVVETEGHNLLVTDNGTNTLYFYTIDKDKPIGSPLKLRASIDLTRVGQEEIPIQKHNLP